jgi:hypothetical protein
MANTLLAAIICSIIRSKEFSKVKLLNSDQFSRGPGVDMLLTTGALLQALAEQLAGEIDICNDRSTGEKIVSYFDWAKELAMKGARKLAELEAHANHTPSWAQVEHWEKEVVAELKESFRTTIMESAKGIEAMEKFVRTVQSHDITREARWNITRMVKTGLLSNKGEMIGIEREAKANLIAHFYVESNTQEDEWRAAYFQQLMEHLKGGHTNAQLVPNKAASQFVWDLARAINAEVKSCVDCMVCTVEQTATRHIRPKLTGLSQRQKLRHKPT